MSQSLLNSFSLTDSYDCNVWLTLEKIFHDNKEVRDIQIDIELINITMGDLTIHTYCFKIKSLVDLLANPDAKSKVS